METEGAYVRRVCVTCGAAALVDEPTLVEPYRCAQCRTGDFEISDEELAAMHVSSWWSDAAAGAAGAGGAFAVMDAIFNPAAARARERVKGDHERQVPKPSPGDDALRTGELVIRVPKSSAAQEDV